MKMKLFAKTNRSKDGIDLFKIETEINQWLKDNPGITILDKLQSTSGGSLHATKLFITIWYEDDGA